MSKYVCSSKFELIDIEDKLVILNDNVDSIIFLEEVEKQILFLFKHPQSVSDIYSHILNDDSFPSIEENNFNDFISDLIKKGLIVEEEE